MKRNSMSQLELEKFFGVIRNPRDLLAFKLGLIYAMRVGEIIRVKLSDISNDKIQIQGLKNGRCETYPLTNEIKNLLKEWMKIRPNRGEYLFPTPQFNNNHLSKLSLQKRFYLYCKKSGIGRFSVHSLRHTRAIQLVSRDSVNPFEIQAYMRHKTIGMVLNYIKEKSFNFDKFLTS